MNVLESNAKRDLFLVNPEGNRIVFVPQGWCDTMSQEDEEDGLCIQCWYGNEDTLAFTERDPKDWQTTDSMAYFAVSSLAAMREVTEEEAKVIDPDLFSLLRFVNCGECDL